MAPLSKDSAVRQPGTLCISHESTLGRTGIGTQLLECTAVKDEIYDLELRKTDLKNKLDVVPAPQPRLHPRLADVYRNKIANLVEALNVPGTVAGATKATKNQ
jgi:hypothetical protein